MSSQEHHQHRVSHSHDPHVQHEAANSEAENSRNISTRHKRTSSNQSEKSNNGFTDHSKSIVSHDAKPRQTDTKKQAETTIEMSDLSNHHGECASCSGSQKSAKKKRNHKQRQSGERKDFHIKAWKTPKECVNGITLAASKKADLTLDKLVVLGFLAGVFVSFGGGFYVLAAEGCPGIAASNPGLQKLIGAFCFPIGLLLITVVGGELFTGDIMFFMAGVVSGAVKPKHLALNWSVVLITNFLGCVTGAYFFCYVTQIFESDPWRAGVIAIAEKKTLELEMYVLFFRAIPANMLVCLAIFISIASEDVVSKTVGMYLPIATFASLGFEHSVANMFFVPLGIFYGANVTFGRFLYWNLIPVVCGNIVGGGMMVGAIIYYLYIYGHEQKDPKAIWKWSFIPTA